MAFTLASAAATALAAVYNELAGYFNGSSSYGSNPIKLITLNDAVNPVLTLKNLDTTTGLVFDADKADGTNLAIIDKDGFRYSPDGLTSGLTPVSLSAVETITGAKTFSAATIFNSKVTGKRGTSTASTGALTLPTDGNLVPITGTTAITSITATGLTGLEVTLEFASAGCKVTSGSNLKLEGDFWSVAQYATLTLHCDGTNWIEKARTKASPLCAFVTLTVAQSIPDDTWTAISWPSGTVERNVGPCYAAGNPDRLVAVVPGIYIVSGETEYTSDSTGRRRIGVEKNGTGGTSEWQSNEAASGVGNTASGSEPIVMATAGDYVRIMVRQNRGSALDIAADVNDRVRASLVLLKAL